jgi:hypothetical protein
VVHEPADSGHQPAHEEHEVLPDEPVLTDPREALTEGGRSGGSL